jgi:hypothetical protein
MVWNWELRALDDTIRQSGHACSFDIYLIIRLRIWTSRISTWPVEYLKATLRIVSKTSRTQATVRTSRGIAAPVEGHAFHHHHHAGDEVPFLRRPVALALVFVRGEVLLEHLADVSEKWVMWEQLPFASPRLISSAISVLLSTHFNGYDWPERSLSG